MNTVSMITFAACVGFFATIIYSVASWFNSRTSRMMDRRVMAFQGELEKEPEHVSIATWFAKLLGSLFPEKQNDSGELKRRLQAAGFYHPSACSIFIGCRIVLVIAAVFLGAGSVFIPQTTGLISTTWTLLCVGVAIVAPGLILDAIHRSRHRQILAELPDLADLLTVCLNAGLSLEAAIHFVIDEFGQMDSALDKELLLIRRDLNLGLRPDEAIQRFADRASHPAVAMLATFMKESRKMGMAVSDAIREHGVSIRLEIEQEAEEQSQKAAVKILFPTLLLVMPATFVVLAGPAVIQMAGIFSSN